MTTAEILRCALIAIDRATAGRTLAAWAARWHQRRQLAALPDRYLCDIGVTRADAQAEAAKPPWRP